MSEVVSLEELCTGIIDCPHSTPKWQDKGIPVIRNYNLKDGKIDCANLSFVSEEDYKERVKRAIPEESDIIISREAPMGVVGIVPKGFQCCLGQRLVLLKIDKSKCLPKYLLYTLMSEYVQLQIRRINQTGSIVSNLNISSLRELKIPLHSFEEQKKIANILSAIDDKISLNNQINQDLEAMAKTLYDYWFVQFDFPDQNGKPYKSSGGKMVYHPELKREIPEGWGVTKLNEVVDLISGYPFSSNDYVTSGKYKLYTIKNVQDGYTVDKVDNYLDFLPSNMSHECQLRRGDLIMSLTGNVGRVGMVYEDDVLLNQRVLKLNPINKTHKSFIYSFFRSDVTKAHLENMSTGTSQKNLSPIDIGNMMIPFPSESLLSKFLDNLNMLENNLVENQQLTKLRDWLLPMLMNGQVKVK